MDSSFKGYIVMVSRLNPYILLSPTANHQLYGHPFAWKSLINLYLKVYIIYKHQSNTVVILITYHTLF